MNDPHRLHQSAHEGSQQLPGRVIRLPRAVAVVVLFAALALAALVAPPPSGASPQDIFHGKSDPPRKGTPNKGGDTRRGSKQDGPRDCACQSKAEYDRMFAAEYARANREIGEMDRRDEQEDQRYWSEYERVKAQAIRTGGRNCETCTEALAPVDAKHDRNRAQLDLTRRQVVAAAQCRIGWINGGCCGLRPRCFTEDPFKLKTDPDAIQAQAEAEVEKAMRQVYDPPNSGGDERDREAHPPLPPPLTGGVEKTGNPPPRPGVERDPAKGTKKTAKKAGEEKPGPPPWGLVLGAGVVLVTAEGVKDLSGPAAVTGLVCVSEAAVQQQLAQAKQFELHSWEQHKELQQADRQWQQEQHRHMKQMDELARKLQDEPKRHAEALRRIEQQRNQMAKRHQEMMKSADPNTREIERRRYEQNLADLQKASQQEMAENVGRDRMYREQGPRDARELHRKNVDRIIDKAAKTPEQRERMRREADLMARRLEQMSKRPTPPPRGPHTPPDPRAQLRLENFRRDWDIQWARYQGYLDGWQAEWNFEQQRHSTNPFQTTAEAERHAAEIARLNARARCLMGEHLAALDSIRLKYRLW